MSGDAIVARLVRIEGHVQGVWYRGWTVEQAQRRGVNGWVRNRLDGSVEALFVGPDSVINAMIAACHQGPPAARVKTVRVEPAESSDGVGFQQRPTV